MPRNRNCGVINNFEFPPEFLKTLPPPDKVDILKKTPQLSAYLCFGEPLSVEPKKFGYGKIGDISSSSDYDNISDFDIVSFGRSSASSISWSDEFDVEGTLRVKNELELLDRILQGKEPIPPCYNQDEYEQWMNTFPQLSVFGNTEDVTRQKQQYLENCDTDSTSPQCKKATNSIKFTVIEDTLQNVSSKVPNCKVNKKAEYSHKQINQKGSEKLTKRFDNILRISPVLLQEPVNRSFYLDTKQQSSHSVYKSAKSASKWMREERREYTSLPYLSTMDSAKSKPNKNVNTKAGNCSKLRSSSKASTNKTFTSLPPIKTITLPSASQYRSISATPRKVFNEQLVVSAHIDSLKRRRKVAHDKLGSLRNILNYPK